MSDTMRWRYGETSPVVLPVDAATVIEIGDLVTLEVDDARPAGLITIGGGGAANLAAAQEAFHDKFAGIAMQRSRAGDTTPIRVATRGVFEFDLASTTLEVGALVGVDDTAAGTALENQKVIAVATPNLAVGRVAKRLNPAGSKVLVDIVSTVSHAGPLAAA
ncbi:MAG: hypothetical protein K1X74_00585 [Pirellulales bacterium]|nr:hypothetical protein [Pirellulales bacterium]